MVMSLSLMLIAAPSGLGDQGSRSRSRDSVLVVLRFIQPVNYASISAELDGRAINVTERKGPMFTRPPLSGVPSPLLPDAPLVTAITPFHTYVAPQALPLSHRNYPHLIFALALLTLLVIGQPEPLTAGTACTILRSDSSRLYKRSFTGTCPEAESAIPAEDLLRAMGSGRSIDVTGAHIFGDLDFTRCHIRRHVLLGKEVRLVKQIVRFKDSFFHGLIKTGHEPPVAFENEVSFFHSVFAFPVDFEGAIFRRGVTFDLSTFSGDANFKALSITGNASFFDTKFTQKRGHLQFVQARIEGDLLFRNATVESSSLFNGMTVTGEAEFERTKFLAPVKFDSAGELMSRFAKGVDFRWVDFTEPSFVKVDFLGDVTFDDAAFLGSQLNLEGAVFSKDVRFRARSMPTRVVLRRAEFLGQLDFRGAVMKAVEIVEVSPETRVTAIKLDWETWSTGFLWLWIPFMSPSTTILDGKGSSGGAPSEHLRAIIELYKTIEKSLRQDDVAAANEVYYRRKLLERSRKGGLAQLWEWAVPDGLLGYFVRIARPSCASVTVWLLCAWIFGRFTVLKRDRAEWSPKLSSLPLTLYEGDTPAGFGRAGYWSRLALSAALLTKFSLGREYKTSSRRALLLAKAEWVLGLFLIATLLVAFIQNAPDFERLLRSTVG